MKRIFSVILLAVILISITLPSFAAQACPYCQRAGYVSSKKVFEMFYYQTSGNYIREVRVFNTYEQCGACYKKWNYDTLWEYGPWYLDPDRIS